MQHGIGLPLLLLVVAHCCYSAQLGRGHWWYIARPLGTCSGGSNSKSLTPDQVSGQLTWPGLVAQGGNLGEACMVGSEDTVWWWDS